MYHYQWSMTYCYHHDNLLPVNMNKWGLKKIEMATKKPKGENSSPGEPLNLIATLGLVCYECPLFGLELALCSLVVGWPSSSRLVLIKPSGLRCPPGLE
jgi:hypothetical protein